MKFFITILFFIVSFTVFSQIRAEDVKNKKDMLKFLDEHYFKGNRKDTVVNYYNTENFTASWNDKTVMKYFFKENKSKWVKLDLNKDGKSDIVWNGCFNESARVIAFISFENKYKIEPVSLLYEDDTYHIISAYDSQKFVLCRLDREKIDTAMHYSFLDRFMYDTVEYSDGILIASNLKNIDYSIDTIRCKIRGLYITSSDDITVCKSGKVYISKFIYSNSDTGRRKMFYKNITADSIRQLFSLVNRLPYYSFKKSYHPVGRGPFDGHHFNAEFVFNNGESKKISDYLAMGPFGLRYLFKWIMMLRKDSNWFEVVE